MTPKSQDHGLHFPHGGGGGMGAIQFGAEADITQVSDTTKQAGATGKVADAGHQHDHGNRAGGTLHDAVTQQVNGFMLAGDKLLLDTMFGGQAANTVLGGPPTGGNASPSFRALTVPDLPGRALQMRIQVRISGAIAAGSTKYAAPGTIAGGASAHAKLMDFSEPGVATAPQWSLLRVVAELGTAPGVGESVFVTVARRNAGAWGDTTMALTLSGTDVEESTETNPATFTGAQAPAIKVVSSGGSNAADLDLTLILQRTA